MGVGNRFTIVLNLIFLQKVMKTPGPDSVVFQLEGKAVEVS